MQFYNWPLLIWHSLIIVLFTNANIKQNFNGTFFIYTSYFSGNFFNR